MDEDIVYSMERVEPPFASSVAITGMVNRENMKRYFECDNMASWIHFNYYFFRFHFETSLCLSHFIAFFPHSVNIQHPQKKLIFIVVFQIPKGMCV